MHWFCRALCSRWHCSIAFNRIDACCGMIMFAQILSSELTINHSLFSSSNIVSLSTSLRWLLDARLSFLPHPLAVMVAFVRYASLDTELLLFLETAVFLRLKCLRIIQCFCFLQEVLYCAKKAGVTHILKAGGAQVERYLMLSSVPQCSLVPLMLFTFRQSQPWHGERHRVQRYLKTILLSRFWSDWHVGTRAFSFFIVIYWSPYITICLLKNCKYA